MSNNLSRVFVSFILLFTFYLSHITPVYAHFLQTDGSIGAVLHIDPDDDPIVGQQAGFFFEFKDTKNKFQPQNCDCTFSVTEDGKEIFSQPLFQNNSSPSLTSASVFFTFPEKNVYNVTVSGKPLTVGAFQQFTLTYPIRVERGITPTPATQTSSQDTAPIPQDNFFVTHFTHTVGAVIIGLFLLFVFFKQFVFNKKKEKPSEQETVLPHSSSSKMPKPGNSSEDMG